MTKDKYFEWRKLGFIAQNDLGIIDANLISKINHDDDIFDIIDFFNKFGAPEGLGHQDNYIYLKQDKNHDIHELRIFTDLEEEKKYFNLEKDFVNELFSIKRIFLTAKLFVTIKSAPAFIKSK